MGSDSRDHHRPDAAATTRHRRLLPWGLFLLAPYVGEFVLGNQPITAFPLTLILLAPMYGGGALLIRETVRRSRGGWPAIMTLAAAYALVEEGLVDQMITDPAYLGLDSFAGHATVLGISLTLTAASLTLHTVWSICVPIAILEAFDPDPPRPWLRRRGLVVTSAVFLLGSFVLAFLQYEKFRFVSDPAQSAMIGAAILVLVAIAAVIMRRPVAYRRTVRSVGHRRSVPSPLRVGLAGFVLSSCYWVPELVGDDHLAPWLAIAVWALFVVGCGALLRRASNHPAWGRMHRLALASGVLFTYAWAAVVNTAFLGLPPLIGAVGNLVFGASAVALVVTAVWIVRRRSVVISDFS